MANDGKDQFTEQQHSTDSKAGECLANVTSLSHFHQRDAVEHFGQSSHRLMVTEKRISNLNDHEQSHSQELGKDSGDSGDDIMEQQQSSDSAMTRVKTMSRSHSWPRHASTWSISHPAYRQKEVSHKPRARKIRSYKNVGKDTAHGSVCSSSGTHVIKPPPPPKPKLPPKPHAHNVQSRKKVDKDTPHGSVCSSSGTHYVIKPPPKPKLPPKPHAHNVQSRKKVDKDTPHGSVCLSSGTYYVIKLPPKPHAHNVQSHKKVDKDTPHGSVCSSSGARYVMKPPPKPHAHNVQSYNVQSHKNVDKDTSQSPHTYLMIHNDITEQQQSADSEGGECLAILLYM